jgi:hypothetical protein
VKSAPSDLPAQLLEAVHRRDADASRRLANQWAHRRGVSSLADFVSTTLGQAQSAEAVAWLEQLLDCPLDRQPQAAAPVLEFARDPQGALPLVAEQPEALPPLSVPVPLFSENPVPEEFFEVEHEGAVLVTISEPHQGWPPASASLEAVVESTLDEALVAYSLTETPASGLNATEVPDSRPIGSLGSEAPPAARPFAGPSGNSAGLAALSAEPPLLSPDPTVLALVSGALRSQGLSRVGPHQQPEVPLASEVPFESEVPLESPASIDRGPLTRLKLRLRHALDTAMAPFQASGETESFEPASAAIGETPIREDLPPAAAPSSPFAVASAPVAGEFTFPIPRWTAEPTPDQTPDQTPDPSRRLKMPSLPRSNRPAPAPEALADLRIWLPDAAEDLPRAS